MPRLLTLFQALGIIISKRQLVRLLIAGQDDFLDEARDVLRAGLTNAPWITADDTGARHKAANGFCTQIGNAHFAWFVTTGSKSRGNFLELQRAGHRDCVINAEALAYMRQRALAGAARQPRISRYRRWASDVFVLPCNFKSRKGRRTGLLGGLHDSDYGAIHGVFRAGAKPTGMSATSFSDLMSTTETLLVCSLAT